MRRFYLFVSVLSALLADAVLAQTPARTAGTSPAEGEALRAAGRARLDTGTCSSELSRRYAAFLGSGPLPRTSLIQGLKRDATDHMLLCQAANALYARPEGSITPEAVARFVRLERAGLRGAADLERYEKLQSRVILIAQSLQHLGYRKLARWKGPIEDLEALRGEVQQGYLKQAIAPTLKEARAFVENLPALVRQGAEEAQRRPQTPAMQNYLQQMSEGWSHVPKVLDAGAKAQAEKLERRAVCLAGRGDLEAAARARRAALEVYERAYGPDSPSLVNILASSSHFHLEQSGDFEEALAQADRVIAIEERMLGGKAPGSYVGTILTGAYQTRALALAKLGRQDEAKVAARRSLALADQSSPTFPVPPGIGGVEAGLVKNALKQTQDLRRLGQAPLRALLGETSASEVPVQGGNVFVQLVEAQALYESDRWQDLQKVIESASQATHASIEAAVPMGMTTVIMSLSGLLYGFEAQAIRSSMRHPEEAYLRSLAYLILTQRKGRAYDLSARAALEGRGSDAGNAEVDSGRALRERARAGRSRRAAAYLARLKEQQPLDLCERDQDQGKDAALEEAQHELELAAYRGKEMQSRGGEVVLSSLSGLIGTAKPAKPAQEASAELLQQLGQRLAEGEAVVDFVHYTVALESRAEAGAGTGSRYGVYLLRKQDREVRYFDLGPAEEIEPLVVGLLAELRKNGPLKRIHHLSDALGEKLWAPLSTLLSETPRVYVVPDAALQAVPFDALRVGGKYLFDRHELSYLDSVRDLIERRASARHERLSGVVFADPAAPARRYPHPVLQRSLPALPGAREEAKQVSAWLGGAPVLLGSAASEAALFAVNAPQVLHFAGHALFLPTASKGAAATTGLQRGIDVTELKPDAPSVRPPPNLDEVFMHAALVLADDSESQPQGVTDGFATAYELARIELRGTRLVFLSACDTAAGIDVPIHGASSLSRALTMAGAESVVASLWPVADDRTVELVAAFYRELTHGKARSESLRAAMAELRQRAPHPRYWAAFKLTGDPSPLVTANAVASGTAR